MPNKIKVETVGTVTPVETTPIEAPEEVIVETPLEVVVETPKEEVVVPVIIPSREDSEVEKKWMDKAERMRRNFEAQPKVRVLIPIESGETPGVIEKKIINGREVVIVKGGAVWSKTFNGYRVIIPKGVYTEVAQQVADNISKEYSQTLSAGDQWKIDRIDPTTGRSVREQLS